MSNSPLHKKQARRQFSLNRSVLINTEAQIYQFFLEEMQQLEKFKLSNENLFGDTPLESEDPYTKRLIESLAFFSARTRQQGTKKIVQLHQCLFRQYFPFLVNSLPAFTMLQVKPTIRFPGKVTFPVGSELVLKTTDGLQATFQTLDPLHIYPLYLKKCAFYRRGDAGWRFLIEYKSPHIMTDELGNINLYINHLNNFSTSLSVFFAMQYALEKVHVFYDQESITNEEGLDCSIQFGNTNDERRVYNHFVEQIRSKLHFPQQEMFINLDIPPANRRWQTLAICFDFDNAWPENIKLTSESLIPFVTPLINLKMAYADPVLADGTKDSHPILYPEPTEQFELHSLVNVQEILPVGTRSLMPGFLSIEGSTYEVDYFEKRLMVSLPGIFIDPKTITIQALWSQPWFSNYINDELQLQFTEADSIGLESRLLGSIQRYENTLGEDPDFLIRILSLKNQNQLSLNEILFILDAMKNIKSSVFDVVPEYIKEMKVNKKISQKRYSTVLEYEFFLKELGGQKTELFFLFFKYVNELLNCWLANYEVESKVHFPRRKQPLIIKQGTTHELSTLARDFFLS